MPEELSRAEKVAKAGQLRAEISSNRMQAEHNAAAAAAQNHDAALDRELEALEREAAETRLRAESSGTVSDAMAAMNAAAEVTSPPVVAPKAEEKPSPANLDKKSTGGNK